MINCKHKYHRVVKSLEGIPCGYEIGCFNGKDPSFCSKGCDGYEPEGDGSEICLAVSSASTIETESKGFVTCSRRQRKHEQTRKRKGRNV